jgi:beta-mannanase
MNARTRVLVGGALVAAVAAGATLVGCTGQVDEGVAPAPSTARRTPSDSPPVPPPPPVPFPAPGKVFLGLQTNLGGYDFTAVDAFTAATHHQPSVLQFSQGWAENQFDPALFDRIAGRGLLPILSWEPWNYTAGVNQPAYQLSDITDGRYDAYARNWAAGIAALRYPVVIRFGHEMNGFWFPWCEQANGNRPGDYVKAWRHLHDLFTAARVTNVTWLWSPNVTYTGATALAGLYPGDGYVDWIGLSGYYGTAGRTSYLTFDAIFTHTLAELRTFANKPVIVAETGATNAAGQQAAWIQQMFTQLPEHPEIIGVIWFEAVKEIDWRIANSTVSAAAYGAGAADPRYDTPWALNGYPRRA